jgi:hypothetical protein
MGCRRSNACSPAPIEIVCCRFRHQLPPKLGKGRALPDFGGATQLEPRATPWDFIAKRMKVLKGRANASRIRGLRLERPFRACWNGVACPRALPGAGGLELDGPPSPGCANFCRRVADHQGVYARLQRAMARRRGGKVAIRPVPFGAPEGRGESRCVHLIGVMRSPRQRQTLGGGGHGPSPAWRARISSSCMPRLASSRRSLQICAT